MPNFYVLAALSDSHEKNAFFAFHYRNAILIIEISDFCKKYYVSSLMFKSMHVLNLHWINNNILMACENHDRNTFC